MRIDADLAGSLAVLVLYFSLPIGVIAPAFWVVAAAGEIQPALWFYLAIVGQPSSALPLLFGSLAGTVALTVTAFLMVHRVSMKYQRANPKRDSWLAALVPPFTVLAFSAIAAFWSVSYSATPEGAFRKVVCSPVPDGVSSIQLGYCSYGMDGRCLLRFIASEAAIAAIVSCAQLECAPSTEGRDQHCYSPRRPGEYRMEVKPRYVEFEWDADL